MRYRALCCDYDGTLASGGRMLAPTRDALQRVRAAGRKVLLVTGRRLDDLANACPDLSPFDVVVAENGAVLHWPATRERKVLGERPPDLLLDRLRARGVSDVAAGEVIVATRRPHETVALEVIQELGLELALAFNKGAVMILPSGVNKATGLGAALEALDLTPHEAVGIGDAENDHAFLARCECAVAVQNALPMLKERADLVTAGDDGAGVVELVDRLLSTDLAELAGKLGRHDIPIGTDVVTGREVKLPAYGATLLLAGTSGGGKSTLVASMIEQLTERGHQFCIVDPEGDHGALAAAAVVGDRQSAPTVDEVLKLLERPARSAVVNLVATGIENRPAFFEALMPRLLAMRAQTGRPHFIVVDEAHHLAPESAQPAATSGLAADFANVVLVTVHPQRVAPALLQRVDGVIAVGAAPGETIGELARAVGDPPPAIPEDPLGPGEALLWWRGVAEAGAPPLRVRTIPPAAERRRHVRKYAQGDLGEERSFYFRGRDGRLNLKAQNLALFLQVAEGVDDETWRYHLEAGDYSRWLREGIKDNELAAEVAALEREGEARSPVETRRAVRAAIERRYTAPA